MTPEETQKAKAIYELFCENPTGEIVRSTDLEWGVCYALSLGGWDVYPGDGAGIVCNMIRDAIREAERDMKKRCAETCRTSAAGYENAKFEMKGALEKAAAAIEVLEETP